jgi:lipopolysaccharide assembly outer membrane protein LptD (OstA)
MLKRTIFIAVLLQLSAAAAASDVRLTADSVRTWTADDMQVFMLEGRAGISSDALTLNADNMVVWFDRGASRRSGAVTLSIYSESLGGSDIVDVAGGVRLVLDDSALSAAGKPVRSELLSRAISARMEREKREEAARESAGSSSSRKSLLPFEDEAAAEPVTIDYFKIDEDGFSQDVERHGPADAQETRIITTGGIEIAYDVYRMRARSLVIFFPPSQKGDRFDSFSVYAEGDVVFTTPSARMEADRLYYDYASRRAVLLDASVHSHLSRTNLPLVVRAREVRALSERHFEARDAYVTTCEFGLPHYRVESREVTLTTRTSIEDGDSALVVARGNRFYLGKTPALYLPRLARDLKGAPTPLRRVEVGNSSDFGNYVTTRWDLLDIFSGGSAESVSARVSMNADASLLADYYDERGPAGGLDADYRADGVAGRLFGYYVNDRGTDANGFTPTSENRWRAKWRQRMFFDEVQIDTELSKISDAGFLREYFEREDKEGKEQETYISAKRTWDHSQASAFYGARLNDFQSQTERLGEAGYEVVSYPGLEGALVYDSSTRAGNLRYRPGKDLLLPSYQTQRADTRHEIAAPLRIAPGFNITPFATARGTWYDDDVWGESAARYAASWGVKVGLPTIHRIFNVESETFDVHRLRHIAALDFTFESMYDATRTPDELLQFDSVDMVDTLDAATIRLRQRLQTRRPSGEEGGVYRTVDLVTFETEADYFPQPARDNAGDPWSDVRFRARTNVTDDLAALFDADYDTYDGKFDEAGVWIRSDHSPRTVVALGSRYLRNTRAGTVTARVDHKVTEKWELGLAGQYDVNGNALLDETILLRRALHHFFLEIAFDYDKGRDDTTVKMRFYPVTSSRNSLDF